MVLNLDRYVAGNQEAFCVVRVLTEAEEQARSRSRQRESLQKAKQRLAAQGRSHGRGQPEVGTGSVCVVGSSLLAANRVAGTGNEEGRRKNEESG